MTHERTDAPNFDLPPLTTGEDALQVGPADVPVEASADTADAFAMRTSAPKPASKPAAPVKPAKPVSAEANAGVIAALMGKPIPKVAKKPDVKAAAAAAVGAMTSPPATPPKTPSIEPAATLSTLDAAAPVATESVIDFETPAAADLPVGATPASPAIAEPAEIAAAAATADAGDAGVAPTEEIAAEPFVTFELTQTPLPASLAVTDAAMTGVPTPSAEPLAVAFEPVQPPTPAVQTKADVRAEIVPEVTEPPPAAIVPPAIELPRVPAVEASPPAKSDAKPAARRPASPLPADAPKRPIPVAPVWPTPAQAAAQAEPTPDAAERPSSPKAQSLRPKAPVPAARPTSQPRPVEPELPAGRTGAWWTIPLTFVGIAIVACAVIIPAAEDTRRDAYELAKIEQSVEHFQQQSAVNADFLDRVNTDATLAERLAMRQLHQTRPGVKLAPLANEKAAFGASPFAITQLDPPQPLPPFQPSRGPLAEWFLGDKRPQQMAALGLLIAGIGVMVGGGRRPAILNPPPLEGGVRGGVHRDLYRVNAALSPRTAHLNPRACGTQKRIDFHGLDQQLRCSVAIPPISSPRLPDSPTPRLPDSPTCRLADSPITTRGE